MTEAEVKLQQARQRVEELRIKLNRIQGDLSRAITEEQAARHAAKKKKKNMISDPRLQVSVLTPDICIEDLPKTGSAHMRALASKIQDGINFLIEHHATSLSIIWREIPTGAIDGTVGFFVVSGKINKA